jgi:hypothetical protein
MGAGTSAPKIDYSTAQFSSADVSRQIKDAATKTSESVWGYAKTGFWILGLLLVFGAIGTGLYYYFAIEPDLKATLVIDSAKLVDPIYGATGADITSAVTARVQGDALYLPKGVSDLSTTGLMCLAPGATGATGPSVPCQSIQGNLALSFHFSGTTKGLDTSSKNPPPFPVTKEINISLANENIEPFTNKRTKPSVAKQAGPTLLGRIANLFNPSGSSADLLPYAKEARTEALIPSASAPLSGGQDGAYGMQFWMYVQDWNYKYGVEKHVVSRSDPTNPAIMNPSVSLHPTDNTLNISVSVFGSSSSSKTEPAPYGHSGATDDVFLCEVPDIPLQTWCSVSVTLFSRNLDVYLNGKLVKSCVLSGVPKPVAGDIYLNSGGGFSGYLCSFYHYPRMLTPDDASAFYSQGTSCTSATDASLATKTTGYGFKFGVYDAAGKQLSQYVL